MLLVVAALLALVVSGCGGGQSAAQINAQINAQATQPTIESALQQRVNHQQQVQAQQDASQARAAAARAKQLDRIQAEQTAATQRAEAATAGGDANSVASQPLGSSSPAVEKFKAQVSGVCAGTQKRITAISDASKKAVKSKDPSQLLAVAQSYNTALTVFVGALGAIHAPASEAKKFAKFQSTLNQLFAAARQSVLLSATGGAASQAVQAKTAKLTTEFVLESADLGVTCLSSVG